MSAGEGAWQNLTLDFDGGIATWNRGGTGPELYQVFIEYSRDGVTYSPLGNGQRITNGWQITSLSWLPWANIYLRARGFTTGGFYNGSSGLVESVRRFHNGANDVPVALCRSAIVLAGTNGTAAASIDNGSFDPDPGDTITLVQTPPGPYPPGTNAVTLTVTDNHGDWSSCNATVTVFRLGQTSEGCPTLLRQRES